MYLRSSSSLSVDGAYTGPEIKTPIPGPISLVSLIFLLKTEMYFFNEHFCC